MPGMQTLAQGQKDLDKICEEIDQICSDKIVHEQANEKYIEQIQCQNPKTPKPHGLDYKGEYKILFNLKYQQFNFVL